MQIKKRGNKTVCFRHTYDSFKGRGVQTLAYSCDSYLRSVPDDAKEKLNEAELVELKTYLDERLKEDQAYLKESSLLGLDGALRRALEALAVPEAAAQLTPEKAAKIWEGLDAMRLALKHAGHPRPKKDAE
jgi:hypothetical protein